MKKEQPFTVFVVEDDEWYNKYLVHTLSMNPEIFAEGFQQGNDFLKRLNDRPDVVTLDYRLPDATGAGLLKKIRAFDENISVIIISEQTDVATAVELLKDGAFDYLVKSDDLTQKLHNLMGKIKERNTLKRTISHLQREVEHKYAFSNLLLGRSSALQRVFGIMEKAVSTDLTVSVSGETGTGKDLVAKAIHFNSPRRTKALVAVNMSAIPHDLAESELFGHEKGAFTGAVVQRHGKFEEGHGGTLFLDEIADMSLHLQVKLLRVLQEREVTRVGSNTPLKIDCRIIVATHKDLAEEVSQGRFREDLYYRLLGLTIHMPPLRERGDDILLLARYFSDTFCKENNLVLKSFCPDATQKLMEHPWPGNIRELKSVVETATVLAGGDKIEPQHLQLANRANSHLLAMKELTMKEHNLQLLQWYLEKYNHRIAVAAEKLGISLATAYRMMKEIR
jgi:two-component system, NtrC family, response regulator AtoC